MSDLPTPIVITNEAPAQASAEKTTKSWALQLAQDVKFEFDNTHNVRLERELVAIAGNKITLRAGYAWDGLQASYFNDSPFIRFAIGFLKKFDAVLTEAGLPSLWQATLLYDVFMQYKKEGELQDIALQLGVATFKNWLQIKGVNPLVIALITTTLKTFTRK